MNDIIKLAAGSIILVIFIETIMLVLYLFTIPIVKDEIKRILQND